MKEITTNSFLTMIENTFGKAAVDTYKMTLMLTHTISILNADKTVSTFHITD